MTTGPGSYRPVEADGADAVLRDSERAEAYAAARLIERAMPADPMTRPGNFVDRVMAAVAVEPAPRAAGFLGAFTAHPRPATFLASIRSAWRTAGDAAGRPFRIRATALAYVLAVLVAAVSLTGVATIGTAGALGWFQQNGSPEPSGLVASPDPSPSPSDEIGPSGSPEPSESAEPSESVEPSGSSGPQNSLEPGRSPRPTPSRASGTSPSPAASDDHGESPSPSSSDDSGGSSSPSYTPRPSDTPKPSETPH